ncbi:MAG: HAD-IIB family hydrolase, partial [Candidatus Aenigmarchaeota archaeon]|nr:HAD-IIB family hydrolase [Candidatus Aenigmarchaeota archaeon]
MQKTQNIIFSDLDGTLIGHSTYSYKAALDTLSMVKKKKIPLIFCTSKTRAEIEKYRKELGIKDPFISENGGAIFVPKNYFDFDYSFVKSKGNYNIIELGTPISKLIKILEAVKQKGYAI